MRIAAIQHDIVWEDAAATHEHVSPMIERAAAMGARLVSLTEMFSCGFSMNTGTVAEPTGGSSASFLAEHAAQLGVWVAASIPTLVDDELPVNRFHLCGPAGELHTYDKVHPFSFAGETDHYQAGTELITVEIEGVRISPLVCYDLRFADEFWQLAPATDLYLVVANWPRARRRHWNSLLVARAIENQAYVVGVNRVGEGAGLDYSGDSRIIDPMGTILAGHCDDETILVANIDPVVVAETRDRFRFMQDRR